MTAGTTGERTAPTPEPAAAPAPPRPPARPPRPAGRREARAGLLFVAPMLLLFTVFRFGPTLGAVFLSLTDYRIGGDWSFVGTGNYARLLKDDLFWSSLGVTALYTLFFVPLTVGLSLGTALLLHRTVWLRGFFRGVFFLPYVTSVVLAAVVWEVDLRRRGRPAQRGARRPVAGPRRLPRRRAAGPARHRGRLRLEGLRLLDAHPPRRTPVHPARGHRGRRRRRRHRLAAAALDHAAAAAPVLFFVLVIEAIGAFQVFDAMYVMTAGGPVRASYSLVYLLYDTGFKFFDFGYASALGLALFLVVLVFSLIQRRLIGRDE